MKRWPVKTYLIVFAIISILTCSQATQGGQRGRFQVNAETVTDNRTGLMWARHDNGSDIGWAEAEQYCHGLNLGGFADWRMPTQEELASLYVPESSEDGGFAVPDPISLSACCLWAADRKGAKVASFDFDYGNRDWGYPTSTVDARVLPVRGGNGTGTGKGR